MVSSAISENMHARVSFSKTIKIYLQESEGRVQFEVFGKLTSVCFSKLHEKPYLVLLVSNIHEKIMQSHACV